ncbi:hypothetical protein JET76_27675 [Pseudomonas putida]|uniref:Uncharacterized protein n=1 Tax=Pseudomonas putida TaxID=303 RepID=A0A7W2L1Q8_PSEPU|nr:MULTISPECIES: hypothetical protein [Pseudomonas]MBA6116791.1 hypothetical protein [Pseudomonas putida]MBI6945097.1 hypothetical protein [Pseudomonas putida]MBI6961446.1 hypothetical protein [Pseudomonas putida]MEC4877039.1 hypothetical protein [Pseudomonas sp. NC26]PZQ40852.1 MAG: hypothetical protein DI560_08095 [Pseudomonas putida]
MFNHPTHPETLAWFTRFNVAEEPYSVCSIDVTTEPTETWFFQRNRLRPESLKLELSLPLNGKWRVELSRHDNLFNVQWRPDDQLCVESQQLRYSKLIKWPRLYSLMDFPSLVGQLEACLEVRFVRHADFGARLLQPETLARNALIREWLAPACDTFGWARKIQAD